MIRVSVVSVQGIVSLQPLIGSFVVSESANENDMIGKITNRAVGSTLTLINNANNRVKLIGDTIYRGSNPLDFEEGATFDFIVEESKEQASRQTTLTVTLSNVFEKPNLQGLLLNQGQINEGTYASISILNATPESVITGSVPDGMTLNSSARTITGTPTTVGDYSFSLIETLGDSANSPKTSDVSLSVVVGSGKQIWAFTGMGDSLVPGTGNLDSERTVADPEIVNGYQYVNRSTRPDYAQIIPDASPLWHTSNDVGRISPMEPMMRRFQELQGDYVAGIPLGTAGSAFENTSTTNDWNPSTNPVGDKLLAAKNAHNDAMSKLSAEGTVHMGGVFICLSSNDKDQPHYTSATYRAYWLDLIDYVRANFAGVTVDTPIILSGPVGSSTQTERGAVVARADVEASAALRENVFVRHSKYPTVTTDNLHPSLGEARAWGIDLGELFYSAKEHTQSIPVITTNPTAGALQGTPISVPLHHTGLDNLSPYGVIEISGGAGASNFEIGGTFHAPRLVQKASTIDGNGNSTLAEGDYVVNLRTRNSDWEYSTPIPFTLSVTTQAAEPVAVTSRELSGPVTTATGGHLLANRTIRKGLNVFWLKMNGTNKDPLVTLKVGGNNAVKQIGGTTSDGTFQIFTFESGVETQADVQFSWGSHSRSAFFGHVSITGVNSTPVSKGYKAQANDPSPHSIPSTTTPANGASVMFASIADGAPYSQNSGSTIIAGNPSSTGNFIIKRESAGDIILTSSSQDSTTLMEYATLTFAKAA